LKLNIDISSSVVDGSDDKDTLGVRVILALLRGYKLAISPYFRGSCRFLPSCADYAAIAVARHGVAYGGWLAFRRLIRCHPLCSAGHDPVPLARPHLWRLRNAKSLRHTS
jgi:putative membrane protein insertion efficiency factor